jgi:hypothetical protein
VANTQGTNIADLGQNARVASQVTVTLGGNRVWSRTVTDGQGCGTTIRDRATLEAVCAALAEALDQAQGEWRLMNDNE